MHIWKFKIEAVEFAIDARLLKTATMDIPFQLHHLKQLSELSESLFPSHLQAGYHVNCVPNDNWVHCGEVFKETWSEEISDKCAVVIIIYV